MELENKARVRRVLLQCMYLSPQTLFCFGKASATLLRDTLRDVSGVVTGISYQSLISHRGLLIKREYFSLQTKTVYYGKRVIVRTFRVCFNYADF